MSKISSKESKKDTVEKFKEKVLDMHRGIPRFYYWNEVEVLVPDPRIRDYLVKEKVFYRTKLPAPDKRTAYFLGVNGMILANSYKIEKLTSTMKNLTIWIIVLTSLTLVITIASVLVRLFK